MKHLRQKGGDVELSKMTNKINESNFPTFKRLLFNDKEFQKSVLENNIQTADLIIKVLEKTCGGCKSSDLWKLVQDDQVQLTDDQIKTVIDTQKKDLLKMSESYFKIGQVVNGMRWSGKGWEIFKEKT